MPDRGLDDLLMRRLSPREINLRFNGNWILTHISMYKYDDSKDPPVRTPAQGVVIAYSSEHNSVMSEYTKRISSFRDRINLYVLLADENNDSRLLPEVPVPESRSDNIADVLENPQKYRRVRRGIPGFNP